MNDRVSGGQAELSGDDIKSLEKLSESYKAVRQQLGKVIVGQDEVIEQLMIAIFAQGHCRSNVESGFQSNSVYA